MSFDEIMKSVDAGIRLLSVSLWPAVIVFLIVRFSSSIKEFLTTLGEFSLKGAGFEATLKRKIEAAAALGAANASRMQTPEEDHLPAVDPTVAAETVNNVVTSRAIQSAKGAKVLWVDDRPANNNHAIQAMESVGIKITTSTSTEDALQRVRQQSFDVIISDMGRPPDPRAGYTLLEKLRAMGDKTPFIIYASSRSPEHQAESKRRGALGCTNLASELFEMVLSALQHK